MLSNSGRYMGQDGCFLGEFPSSPMPSPRPPSSLQSHRIMRSKANVQHLILLASTWVYVLSIVCHDIEQRGVVFPSPKRLRNCKYKQARGHRLCNVKKVYRMLGLFQTPLSSVSRQKMNSPGATEGARGGRMKSGREEKEAESREGRGRRKFEALCELGGCFA